MMSTDPGFRRRVATAILFLALVPACSENRGDLEPIASTVAPLSWGHQKEKIVALDGKPGDRFGSKVALSGDTLVASTYFGSKAPMSATYVFTRNGEIWNQQQKLPAQLAAEHGGGGVVAIFGDTLVVGSDDDDDAGPYTGAAYVFARKDGIWTLRDRLLAEDPKAGSRFGGAVAMSGNTIVLGCLFGSDKAPNAGAAYVFSRTYSPTGETTWSQKQKLVAEDGTTSDSFGLAVAIAGDTIVVGAQGHDDANPNVGAAYVFARSGQSWSLQQELLAADGSEEDLFGHSVAIDGDTIVVGARNDEVNSQNVNAGSVYVFVREGESWSQQQKLVAEEAVAADHFGDSVAISGDIVVAGAGATEEGPGAAYAFRRTGQIWSPPQKLVAPGDDYENHLGVSVAVDGTTIVAGASSDYYLSKEAGAVHAFVLQADAGEPCSAPSECVTGFCVDEVCCHTACDNPGMSCSAAAHNASGIDGFCGAVMETTATSADSSSADATSTSDVSSSATSSGSGGGGGASPERSYYSCAVGPGQGGGAIPGVLGMTILAALSRRRRSARRGALPR